MARFAPRQLVLFLFVLGVLAGTSVAGVYVALRASLPVVDGALRLSGLHSAVRIDRDALGVPTLHASTVIDAMRALGFLHAQERFFQMDLLRRTAAGELAELFGPAALPRDRGHRLHRLRTVAKEAFAQLVPAHRARLLAYRDGVNQGLNALTARPPEYLALAMPPTPWQVEDSLLVVLAMFLDLQDETAQRDADLGLLRSHFPAPMVRFLVPEGTSWDAPLVGKTAPAPPVPDIDIYHPPAVATPLPVHHSVRDPERERAAVGSNAWAVAGSHTAHGGALVAGDMHLGLGVPNIWYRAGWRIAGQAMAPSGLTLPGVPALVAGSNGRIAWTFTNSYGDFSDLIELELDPTRPGHYLSAGGSRPFEYRQETLRVRGGADETLWIALTEWGPLVDADRDGRLRALRWVAHRPEAVNLALAMLEDAQDVPAALAIAPTAGVPAQNFIVGDHLGRIAWTIAGRLPQRRVATAFPVRWSAPEARWYGWLAPEAYPQVLNPPGGTLWSANQRMIAGADLPALGDGGFQLGARASQIRDALAARPIFNENEMLAIQLDDRALFFERWQELLVSVLTPGAIREDPTRQSLLDVALQWDGRAAVDSAAFRVVRAFRLFLAEQIFGYLLKDVAREDARFDYQAHAQWEGPLWQLVSSRPVHLLNPMFADWNAQLLAAADAVVEQATKQGLTLAQFTWGERNKLRMQHPFSQVVPFARRWLDMAAQPLPGDQHMPRVQAPSFGSSQRLVVAPGHEANAILHMPGGQSGHAMSTHYRDSLQSWMHGEPSPLLAGQPRHSVMLHPELP